jgi:sec-independent protein translocase protein TatA
MGLDNPLHIAFLLILMLIVFGAKRLPEMGRSLGSGMRGFKDALSGQGTPFAADAAGTATIAERRARAAASLHAGARHNPDAGPDKRPRAARRIGRSNK